MQFHSEALGVRTSTGHSGTGDTVHTPPHPGSITPCHISDFQKRHHQEMSPAVHVLCKPHKTLYPGGHSRVSIQRPGTEHIKEGERRRGERHWGCGEVAGCALFKGSGCHQTPPNCCLMAVWSLQYSFSKNIFLKRCQASYVTFPNFICWQPVH